MATSHPVNLHNTHTPMIATTAAPAVIPYNQIPNNNNPVAMQYQQPPPGGIVSPVISPVPPREQMMVNPNHPAHVPSHLLSGPVNMNHNPMAWHHHQQQQQQQQQHQQLHTVRSHDSEEHERIRTGSDVSSIQMGSIRPDPNYDPAKDPTSPENIDKPFIAPSEIEIKVVKGRRRKAVASYHSSMSHSTTVTPPKSVEDDNLQKPEQGGWLSSPEHPTTQTGSTSIPKLGMINSFASDASESNSFSGTADRFQTTEERMHMAEEMLELQDIQGGPTFEETKQRKGMVRREFNRRFRRFKKGKKKNKSHEFSTENDFDDDDDSDASGNKIIIKLKIDDDEPNIPEQPKPFKPKTKHFHAPSPFGGRKNHESKSMRMIVGQENGC